MARVRSEGQVATVACPCSQEAGNPGRAGTMGREGWAGDRGKGQIAWADLPQITQMIHTHTHERRQILSLFYSNAMPWRRVGEM